jgi:hypothetical protein
MFAMRRLLWKSTTETGPQDEGCLYFLWRSNSERDQGCALPQMLDKRS